MNAGQVVEQTKTKLAGVTEHLKSELGKLRTGRAHPGMLDGIMVEVYGQQMPLKSVAGITAPEAQQLQVSPFDPNNLQAIASAIRDDQSLGLTPMDDGRVVRITIPPPTTESRQQMVKVLGQRVEEGHISARQVRHDAFRRLEQAEKDKQIGKDELLRIEKQVDELMAKNKAELDGLAQTKEQEIMTV